ncbi:MAG TPA: nucleotidyltransferase domain-containing protein [Candidatus Methanoperedens sp.]
MENEINKIMEDLKKYPDVMAIILFGSYARKRMKPLSDIDIAVIIKSKRTWQIRSIK